MITTFKKWVLREKNDILGFAALLAFGLSAFLGFIPNWLWAGQFPTPDPAPRTEFFYYSGAGYSVAPAEFAPDRCTTFKACMYFRVASDFECPFLEYRVDFFNGDTTFVASQWQRSSTWVVPGANKLLEVNWSTKSDWLEITHMHCGQI